MTYTMHPATQADVLDLVPRLRDADRREVLAFGQEPLQSLLESLHQSREAYTVRADGEMMCMTGVCPLTAIGQTGVPWLLGTDLVRQHARYFMGQSRRLIGRWLDAFPILENRVPFDYLATIRWARWLGFKVEDGSPFNTIRLEAPWSGVRASTMAELWGFANFPRLLEEYADESAVKGLPRPDAKMKGYLDLEASGMIHTLIALRYGQLIGFLTVLAPKLPHYDRTVAVCESFFVTKRHRKTGAGLRLLRRAEKLAASLGSPAMGVSAPVGGALAEVLERLDGYEETSRMFFKRLDQ